MTLPSGLNTRFIRLVAALIIPGAIVAVTFVPFVFHWLSPELKWIADSSKVAQGTGFFILSIFFSMLIEDVSSRIEEAMYERTKDENDDNNWYHYLLRPLDRDSIMVRYIGELVLRMKFELSVMLALPLSLSIWILDHSLFGAVKCCTFVVPIVLVGLICMWMYSEAEKTVKLLRNLRARISDNDIQLLGFSRD